MNKVEAVYQQKMQSNFGRNVKADYWCKRIIGKMGYVMQGNSYVQKMQPDRFECSSQSRSFIRQKMLKMKGKEGAYFESWEAFVSSKSVADKVREKLKAKDINMPESYRIRGRDSFIRGVTSELSRQLKEGFIKQAKVDLGEPVAPMLAQQAFLELPLIQTPLKQTLLLDAHHAPVSLNLSEVQFRDQILIPIVTKELEKERVRLLASSEQFADGAINEADGKQYVRSILIPSVAMGLSMFFALLNLAAVVVGASLLAGASHRIVNAVRLVFIVAVVVLPLLFSGEIAQTRTFQSIEQETSKALGPVGSGFITWLGNLQPMVYPMGQMMADGLNIFPPETE